MASTRQYRVDVDLLRGACAGAAESNAILCDYDLDMLADRVARTGAEHPGRVPPVTASVSAQFAHG